MIKYWSIFSRDDAISLEYINYDQSYNREDSDDRQKTGNFAHHYSSNHCPETVHGTFNSYISVLVNVIYPIQIFDLFVKLCFDKSGDGYRLI